MMTQASLYYVSIITSQKPCLACGQGGSPLWGSSPIEPSGLWPAGSCSCGAPHYTLSTIWPMASWELLLRSSSPYIISHLACGQLGVTPAELLTIHYQPSDL